MESSEDPDSLPVATYEIQNKVLLDLIRYINENDAVKINSHWLVMKEEYSSVAKSSSDPDLRNSSILSLLISVIPNPDYSDSLASLVNCARVVARPLENTRKFINSPAFPFCLEILVRETPDLSVGGLSVAILQLFINLSRDVQACNVLISRKVQLHLMKLILNSEDTPHESLLSIMDFLCNLTVSFPNTAPEYTVQDVWQPFMVSSLHTLLSRFQPHPDLLRSFTPIAINFFAAQIPNFADEKQALVSLVVGQLTVLVEETPFQTSFLMMIFTSLLAASMQDVTDSVFQNAYTTDLVQHIFHITSSILSHLPTLPSIFSTFEEDTEFMMYIEIVMNMVFLLGLLATNSLPDDFGMMFLSFDGLSIVERCLELVPYSKSLADELKRLLAACTMIDLCVDTLSASSFQENVVRCLRTYAELQLTPEHHLPPAEDLLSRASVREQAIATFIVLLMGIMVITKHNSYASFETDLPPILHKVLEDNTSLLLLSLIALLVIHSNHLSVLPAILTDNTLQLFFVALMKCLALPLDENSDHLFQPIVDFLDLVFQLPSTVEIAKNMIDLSTLVALPSPSEANSRDVVILELLAPIVASFRSRESLFLYTHRILNMDALPKVMRIATMMNSTFGEDTVASDLVLRLVGLFDRQCLVAPSLA
ncbi:hypothetical protein BLNAU_12061 [Blattamonas nauphoetae]|uniref:Uncharacterized protein n=1 Tax=Blattamonas nauphoetae TaxID=2049346 RepID=A0ABQ9XNW8_9EUKA|nr:hypothetical protein BLNAU_12061 [Blattamonas nauphoetae]